MWPVHVRSFILAAAWLLVRVEQKVSVLHAVPTVVCRLLVSLLSTLAAEQGSMAAASTQAPAGDPQGGFGQQAADLHQADGGWWDKQSWSGDGRWQQGYGDAWSSYGRNGWSAYGYAPWQWSQSSTWGQQQWQSTTWGGEDSEAQQKSESAESAKDRSGEAPDAQRANEGSDATRRQSASTTEEDPWLGAEGTGSVEEDRASSSRGVTAKTTGKDFIPEYDGSGPMREYQRRVRLFELSTGIDPSFRAQLMEKLTGNAWLATESIPLESLKDPHGVQRLLDHLWKELEPLEFLRTFQTLVDFYKGFRRIRGQEFAPYDMEFRRHAQRLEEVGAGITGVTRAYWFLEKASLSSDLRKQVVAAAGGEYDYSKLRAAVMAIVPQVNKEEDSHPGGGASANRQWRKAPAKVHATVQEDEILDGQEGADEEVDLAPEALEEELQCLLTQAAKKRAQVERARGFGNAPGKGNGKSESPEARAKRVAELKQKMPCSACKAHGRTVYGHWHSDPQCPYNKAAKPEGGNVMAVIEEELSDSDDYGPEVTDVFHAEYWCASAVTAGAGEGINHLLALSDTCCARSVVGEKWAQQHMRHLHELGADVYVVEETRPFRFGAGPRVESTYSIVFPMSLRGTDVVPWIRVSVVPQEVPLLLSKSALKSMGARLDLGLAKIEFSQLTAETPFVETENGLCGFLINEGLRAPKQGRRMPPQEMLEGEMEVSVSEQTEPSCVVEQPEIFHVPTDDVSSQAGRCERVASQLLEDREFSFEALEKLADMLPAIQVKKQRDINESVKGQPKGITAGLWAHGAFTGIAKTAASYPKTIQYVNEFMQAKTDIKWTSFVLMCNVKTMIHRDNHNLRGALSATVSFGDFRGGELWCEKPPEKSSGYNEVRRRDRQGQLVDGFAIDTDRKICVFDPKARHGTQRWVGQRWCLSCYTSRAVEDLDRSVRRKLKRLKFPVPAVPHSRTDGNYVLQNNASSLHQEPLNMRDEVGSPMRNTPFCPADTCVAQPESSSESSDDKHSTKYGDVDHNGLKVHHAEAQGRVRGGHSCSVHSGERRSEEARCGKVETDLEAPQAEEEGRTAPSGVEEVRRGGAEAPVPDDRRSRPPAGERWTLGEVESPATGHGDRHVVSGDGGSAEGRAGGSLPGGADLSSLRDPVRDPNEQNQQAGLLRLCKISNLSANLADDLQRHAGSEGASGLAEGDPGGRPREERGGQTKVESPQAWLSLGKSARSTLFDRVPGKFFGWVMGPSGDSGNRVRHRVGISGEVDQRECDGRRARDAEGAPEDKSGRETVRTAKSNVATARTSSRARSQGSSDHENCKTCKPQVLPRSREEISAAIREGCERRRLMKQGTLKRLLGNTKAIAASVMITSAAVIGMAMQSVPRATAIRPDVLEVFDEEAQVTQRFRRWGCNAASPVDLRVGDDGYDVEGRDGLMQWIDRCQPRLVIVSCPRFRNFVPSGNSKQSQAKRRWNQNMKQENLYAEFVERVFESQMKRGDDAAVSSSVARGSFREPVLRRIMNHPEVYATVVREGSSQQGLTYDGSSDHQAVLWMSTSIEICEELALISSKSAVCNFSSSGSQARQVQNCGTSAAAVCKGYIKTSRRPWSYTQAPSTSCC